MSSRGTRYWSSGSVPLIAPEVLSDIISSASDLAVVISDIGEVLSVLVNPTHPSFGDLGHWEGRDIREVLTPESVAKLDTQLNALSSGSALPRAMELNHLDRNAWQFPIRYTLHQIGSDGALLMLGRDLRPVAEMQQQLVNAQIALEKDHEAKRDYDTRFRVLMDTVREAMVFVALSSGRIVDLNAAAATLLGGKPDEFKNAGFAQEFEGRKRDEVIDALAGAALADSSKPFEATARRSRRRLFLTPRMFRAAGERYLLLRIEGTDRGEPATDDLAENLNGLYQEGADAIVFTDRDGTILSGNDSFLNLAEVGHVSLVRGRPIGDFLGRGTVDARVLIDNAARAGQMALYATRMVSEFGAEIPVEISATYLNDRAHPAIVFVIRDASRAEAARGATARVGDDSIKNVMDLVGSASLKEIVAETTDVVEKMCIETAVELTQNNRVAAAEMLGLSRQSLYVKLRKYGLLNKNAG